MMYTFWVGFAWLTPTVALQLPRQNLTEARIPMTPHRQVMVQTMPTTDMILTRGDADIFMHHMPEKDLVACGCGKCGSTAMWSLIYELTFRHPWNFSGMPYIQDVTSDRWEGKVIHESDETRQKTIMDRTFSFALIRDPKERLVSSWKSKVACRGDVFGTDTRDRNFLTQRLLQLAGTLHDDELQCLSLDDFLQALLKVHEQHLEMYLDRHFLPQSLGCFSKFSPEQWSMVASITDAEAFRALAERLGNHWESPQAVHASTSSVQVSPRALEILDTITRAEYDTLQGHLRPWSRITQAGLYLLQEGPAEVWSLSVEESADI